MVPAPTACSRSSSLRPGLAQIAKEAGAECLLSTWNIPGPASTPSSSSLRIVEGSTLFPSCVCRPTSYHFVARALDAGALGIMVPMVENAQQARDIVSWTRYPPKGRRGAVVGAAHDDYTGGSMKEKFAALNERCFMMLQIETEVGVGNVEEIAAVPGVDSLCIGYGRPVEFPRGPGRPQSTRSISTRYGGLRPRP